MALFPGLPGWAGARKVKPIWILLKQETVSGNGISWAICMSASRSRQITMPVPHHSFFTGRMTFLPPNQQRQSTEGNLASSKQVNQLGKIFQQNKPLHNFDSSYASFVVYSHNMIAAKLLHQWLNITWCVVLLRKSLCDLTRLASAW